MVMQVAGQNIVRVVLFVFEACSHTHLVDPKTAERGRRAGMKSTLRMRKLKY